MNRVYMQVWELSRKGLDILPDGVSLHLTKEEHQKYVDSVYLSRKGTQTPDEYDRVVGGLIETFIEDDAFEDLKTKGSIRLSEVEKNNLLKLEELITKC